MVSKFFQSRWVHSKAGQKHGLELMFPLPGGPSLRFPFSFFDRSPFCSRPEVASAN
jgi:hypothetical protein